MIGIYYKREVIKGFFTKRSPQNSPPSLGRCSLSLVKEKAPDQWIVLSPQSILKLKPKVDVLQVFISAAAIFGIESLWINSNEKVFKTVRYLISAPFIDLVRLWMFPWRRGSLWRSHRCHEASVSFHFEKIKTLLIPFFFQEMSDNKLVKTIMDAATLTGLAGAGIGWIARKVVKGNFTTDPSSNVLNYTKFIAVITGSVALQKVTSKTSKLFQQIKN